jgi:hypothetical protein
MIATQRTNICPRDKLRLLTKTWPKWLDDSIQEFLTWMSGMPYPGQEPRFRSNSVWELLVGSVWMFGGATASSFLVAGPPWLWSLLPISSLFTVGGARNLVLGAEHYCMHGAFSKHRWLNSLVGNAIAVVTMTQDYPTYRNDHINDHHPPFKLATLEHDPDKQLIDKHLGSNSGQSKEDYWARLRALLFGKPALKLHGDMLSRRLKSNFLTAPLAYRVTALAWAALVLSLVTITHSWVSFVVAWVLPLSIGYHVSALLQFLTEHRWGYVAKEGEPWKVVVNGKTLDRFLSEVPPEQSVFKAPLSWMVWVMKMLGHLGIRIGILSSVDLPVHGSYHHWKPANRDWTNGLYVRQRDAEKGFPGFPESPLEVWGFWNAMDVVFESLSQTPPQN